MRTFNCFMKINYFQNAFYVILSYIKLLSFHSYHILSFICFFSLYMIDIDRAIYRKWLIIWFKRFLSIHNLISYQQSKKDKKFIRKKKYFYQRKRVVLKIEIDNTLFTHCINHLTTYIKYNYIFSCIKDGKKMKLNILKLIFSNKLS